MLNRRGFLTRSGLALGALVVGDEALEAFARLTHVRKSFPSAGIEPALEGWRDVRGTATIEVQLPDGRWRAHETVALDALGYARFLKPIDTVGKGRVSFVITTAFEGGAVFSATHPTA